MSSSLVKTLRRASGFRPPRPSFEAPWIASISAGFSSGSSTHWISGSSKAPDLSTSQALKSRCVSASSRVVLAIPQSELRASMDKKTKKIVRCKKRGGVLKIR